MAIFKKIIQEIYAKYTEIIRARITTDVLILKLRLNFITFLIFQIMYLLKKKCVSNNYFCRGDVLLFGEFLGALSSISCYELISKYKLKK